MVKGIFMVRVNVHEGRVEEFIEWYQTYFAPYVCTLPGFEGARVLRYRRPEENTNPDGENAYEYLTIYEIEHDDLNEPLRHLFSAETRPDERVQVTDAVQLSPVPTEWLFEEVFSTPKQDPSVRASLRWHGSLMETDDLDSVTGKVLGWIDKEVL